MHQIVDLAKGLVALATLSAVLGFTAGLCWSVGKMMFDFGRGLL